MKNFLRKAAKAYYDGNPIITDEQWDYLSEKYGFDEVGAKQGDIEHSYRLYSLRKFYTDDDKYKSELSGEKVITPKLDGAALAITYKNEYLVAGTTRGDGIKGKDCTHNIIELDSIPKGIMFNNLIQVDGEAVISKEVKNARNLAAGSLNLKDSEEFRSRNITFIAYDVHGLETDTYYESMSILKACGFNTVLDSFWEEFPQDGKVYRLVDNKAFNAAGHTNNHPRGAFALKDRNEEEVAKTVLLDVKWQVGKGGQVTPVAIFEPVVLDDAIIQRATLHNAGFIEDMDLDIGDEIMVVRAGKIIPKVIGKVE